jgi:hypothetical protein
MRLQWIGQAAGRQEMLQSFGGEISWKTATHKIKDMDIREISLKMKLAQDHVLWFSLIEALLTFEFYCYKLLAVNTRIKWL